MIRMNVHGDRLFQEEIHSFTSTLIRLQLETGSRTVPEFDRSYHELAQAIRTMSRKCRLFQERCDAPEQLKGMQRQFQSCVAPWFDTSWFMARAKHKPRGYPGDFEMLNAIYDGKVRSPGLGGYLDLYFLHSDLAQAVVARMHAARDFLNREVRQRTDDLVILNVASGPCREFFTGLEMPADNRAISLFCIDTDDDALHFVEDQVQQRSIRGLPRLEFVQYNALRMRSAKANIARFGQADLIYSIGLLDYIPDKYLIGMLSGFRDTLKPGGVAYLAFKDQGGYDACEYQWFVDWFFYQRNEEDCRTLFREAGYHDAEINVVRDRTGIIMNFVASPLTGQSRRLDGADRSFAPTMLTFHRDEMNEAAIMNPEAEIPQAEAP